MVKSIKTNNKKQKKSSGNNKVKSSGNKKPLNNASLKKSRVQSGGAAEQETILYYFIGFITLLVIIYLFYNNYQLQQVQQAELRAKIADVDKQLSDLNSNVTRQQQSVFAGSSLQNPAVPDIRGVPINVRTRGEPEEYRNVGYLFINNPSTPTSAPTQPATNITTETNTINLTTNVNVNTNSNNSVLPLYGRRLWNGSDMWNYYVLNENYNQVRLPLTINGKDSMDEYGVKELYDNDTVFIPSQGQTYTVKIYETDDYRYIPY
jgi:cell division protein FtsL